MQKLNTLFVIATSCMLFCVLSFIMFTGLPDNVTRSKDSVLEHRKYQTFPTENVPELLLSGEYQGKLEKALSDRMPMRDSVLLINARMQQACIDIANVPFSFKATHTFFDSDRVFLPEYDAVQQLPKKRNAANEKRIKDALSRWGRVVEACAGPNWYLAIPPRSNILACLPANELVSETLTYEDYLKAFDDSSTFKSVIDLSYEDARAFYDDYYRTDHHWQVMGGIRAYGKIMRAMGKEPVEIADPEVVFDGAFYGSNARSGLFTKASDDVYDADFNHAGIKVKVNDKDQPIYSVDETYRNKGFEKTSRFANVYAEYFHPDYAKIEFQNERAPKGTLVILGDSFTNCIERFFSGTYKKVYVLDPRKEPRQSEADVVDFINRVKPEDVLVLMSSDYLVDGGLFRE